MEKYAHLSKEIYRHSVYDIFCTQLLAYTIIITTLTVRVCTCNFKQPKDTIKWN